MKKMLFFTTAAVASLLLMFTTGCADSNSESSARTNAVTTVYVKAAPLQKRQMVDALMVNGTIEAVNKATISSRVGGTIESIAVDEGDSVRKGDLLFRIDQRSYRDAVTVAQATLEAQQAAVKVAEAQLDKAKAELHKAKLDRERFQRLFDQGNASANELENYQLGFERARTGVDYAAAYLNSQQAQVKLAAATLAIKEKDLQDTEIRAPFDGRIASRNHDPGEEIGAEQAVLYLVDASRLRATASIPAEFYSRIRQNESRIKVTVNGRDIPGEFPVTDKLPVIETSLRTFGIKAEVKDDGSGSIVPGALAGISIILDAKEAFALPIAIPVTRTSGSLLFTVVDGKAKSIQVTTGITSDGQVEVRSPELQEGMTIITEGQYQISDGTPVQVIQ